MEESKLYRSCLERPRGRAEVYCTPLPRGRKAAWAGFLFVCLFGGGMPHSIWILVPLPGIKAAPPCSGSTVLNHQGSPLVQNFERLESVSFTTMFLGRSQLLRCRFLESESHWVVSNSLRIHRLYSPWNSPGQNTGVGSLSLLQWIFPTQE